MLKAAINLFEPLNGGLMKQLILTIVLSGWLTACDTVAEDTAPKPARLHIWFDETGYHQIPQMIAGKAAYKEGSRDLAALIYACDVRVFEVETIGADGQTVSFLSTDRDKNIVQCVQKKAWFDFNAARAIERPRSSIDVRPGTEVFP